jgi:DNA-binding CsgD family transcriptional regulator
MADAAAERTADLTAQCQGARTPGLVRSDAAAALSPREREAAGLAVTGLSNREIADRLGLSKRTVDNALQRVYDKLGLAGRPELAKALGMPADLHVPRME